MLSVCLNVNLFYLSKFVLSIYSVCAHFFFIAGVCKHEKARNRYLLLSINVYVYLTEPFKTYSSGLWNMLLLRLFDCVPKMYVSIEVIEFLPLGLKQMAS